MNNLECNNCGAFVCDCGITAGANYSLVGPPQGWQCPVCQSVWNWTVDGCRKCNKPELLPGQIAE